MPQKRENGSSIWKIPRHDSSRSNQHTSCRCFSWNAQLWKISQGAVSNKHKIEQISATFLSDESSAILQNKVPPKLGDPESYLIPCNFKKAFSYNALADLGKNMLVDVGKFTFPTDFVILEMEEDSKVPFILGRPFLHTADAVI
ncbi:hypothetical protein Tco_1431445 [Tanacetum coccineum]